MTKIVPPRYATEAEASEIVSQAQRLFSLADDLIARAERLRDSAEELIACAHIDVYLRSRPLDSR